MKTVSQTQTEVAALSSDWALATAKARIAAILAARRSH